LWVGGYGSSLLASNTTFRWFNVTPGQSQWTVNTTGLFFDTYNHTNFTETAYAHFNIFSDTIGLPVNAYNRITANLTSQVSGLICNSSFAQCLYKDLCSSIASKVGTLKIALNHENATYNIAPKLLLKDNDNFTCSIQISKNAATARYIDLGAPFHKGFLSIFDVSNSSVGVGLPVGTLSYIS
jgi:hypothetical protein